MKKLGFGLMRLPQLDPANAASVDVEQVKKMVDRFIEKGFTYFDTAWMYAGFASENVAKEALLIVISRSLAADRISCFLAASSSSVRALIFPMIFASSY